jgi:hypothetical protein
VAHYLIQHYKGKYRVKGELDNETFDFPRDVVTGDIDESYSDLYIDCQRGKIYYYGKGILTAYIPSIGKGRNTIKELNEKNIPYTNYIETDEEISFNFHNKYIDEIATLMKAKTSGASISPFSSKNLPKAKVEIPLNEIEEYKKIVSRVDKSNLLLIKDANNAFLTSVLENKYKEDDKSFDYKTDMKKLKLARQTKEYIWTRGLWQEYLEYMNKEITKFYNK